MKGAKYRIVRHEVYGPGGFEKYYTIQRRVLLWWSTMKATYDCSDRVPGCEGTYTEARRFGNEVDAADFLRRYIRDFRKPYELHEVFCYFNKEGVMIPWERQIQS